MSFTQRLEKVFNHVCDEVFASLESGEDAVLNLTAEDSIYLRFNGNRVRQNTRVEQVVLSLRYQRDSRLLTRMRTLSMDEAADTAAMLDLLRRAREESRQTPPDPHGAEIVNNGHSRQDFRGEIPDTGELLASITSRAEGLDLAGLFCGGPMVSANRNSKGQNHWFSTESFFMDYSIYNGPKAVKSVIAGPKWDEKLWDEDLRRSRLQLKELERPLQDVKPGKYRAYLAPGAVSEIVGLLGWGSLSSSALKQGRSVFQKLASGEKTLSPLFTMRENFELGLTPKFNAFGEVAPSTVTMIENGRFKEFLTSSKSAREYDLDSNAASENESPRSPEILPGTLKESEILQAIGTGLYISNLHYLNCSDLTSARITGMTRYACFWVEDGEVKGPIKDLRFDESLYEALGPKLMALTENAVIDPAVLTYSERSMGGKKVPGMLIDQFTFTL